MVNVIWDTRLRSEALNGLRDHIKVGRIRTNLGGKFPQRFGHHRRFRYQQHSALSKAACAWCEPLSALPFYFTPLSLHFRPAQPSINLGTSSNPPVLILRITNPSYLPPTTIEAYRVREQDVGVFTWLSRATCFPL